jgi:acetyl esterase/lipase
MTQTRHLVDPELDFLLDEWPRSVLSNETLPQIRQRAIDMSADALRQKPDVGICVDERLIPGPPGNPPVRVITYTHAKGTSRPAYLHIHGGGYVLGNPEMDHASCMHLAQELGSIVVSVDYRLAPETTFPGNIEDCYAALLWLQLNAGALGADPDRIAIGGVSAGGGLAASLALLARDRNEVKIIHQHLICPMIDDRKSAEDNPYTGEFIWTRADNHFGWTSLLGREPGAPDVSPYAAAARAEDFQNLPPAFISVGTLDLFFDANLEYARSLARAGVPVELHVYPGCYHGSTMVEAARVTKQHKRDQIEALRVAFERTY